MDNYHRWLQSANDKNTAIATTFAATIAIATDNHTGNHGQQGLQQTASSTLDHTHFSVFLAEGRLAGVSSSAVLRSC